MLTIDAILAGERATTAEVTTIFDTLPSVDVPFMIGRWRGSEVATDHSMVGYLSHGGWYGKLFAHAENVHPLLFWRRVGSSFYSVNPRMMPFTWNVPKAAYLGVFMRIAWPLLRTRKSRARLSMVEYRGRVSAAMVYDQKPIIDHFRRVDDETVLGAMDMKGVAEPYFFLLRRD